MPRAPVRHLSNAARAPGWDRLRAIDVNISELSPAPDHARRHPAAQIRDLAPKRESRIFWIGSVWPCQPSLSWSRNHPKPDIAQGAVAD